MEANKLTPATIHTEWRDGLPNWLWFDAATWVDAPPTVPPPVPLITIGTPADRAAMVADVVVADRAGCERLGRAIDAAPEAAAAIVHCLRAGEGLPPPSALLIESVTLAALQASRAHASWLAGRTAAAPSAPGELVLSRAGPLLKLRIDRPAARNAIDRAMRDALFDAFALAAADDDIDCVRLTAIGRCFSVGADLAEFGTSRDPLQAHLIRTRTLPAWPLLRRHGRFEVEVRGACIGSGLELAAFADRLTATADAWFQLPEMAMGILPGFGGTVSIPRRIGRRRAAELMLSGRRLGARAALAIGLIDAIVDDAAGDDGGADQVSTERGSRPLPGVRKQA